MMDAQRLLNGERLLPGDVVVDKATHRPMQVTGYDLRRAEDVPEVWNSDVNHHKYGIEEDSTVLELVNLPRGKRYFVPDTVRRFPECRLDRILTEPATEERRTQPKVVRSLLSHLVADARNRGHDSMVTGMVALMREHLTDDFVDEVEEFAETIEARSNGPLPEDG